jgi:post-segregation antitoxin (ccd killing protein)
MGRTKVDINKKKKSISVAVEPEILEYIKSRHINFSSLIDKLIKDYIKNGNQSLW